MTCWMFLLETLDCPGDSLLKRVVSATVFLRKEGTLNDDQDLWL